MSVKDAHASSRPPCEHAGARSPYEPPGDQRQCHYGALDLGTNNCRLLVARPTRRGFQVVDAFSRIIRLGEGVTSSGRLSSAAMDRTIDALRVCANKLARGRVTRSRLVATEACRFAENGTEFLSRVRNEIGLHIEILSRESEARLAVSGCSGLLDGQWDLALVFDIGGGSSELIWLDASRPCGDSGAGPTAAASAIQSCVAAWTSLPIGVVTLAERFGGRCVEGDCFEDMVAYVTSSLEPFEAAHRFRERIAGTRYHMLGTSGTVTTVAGIHLGLDRYDRSRVDGCWLSSCDVQSVTDRLIGLSYEQRMAEPCVGKDRADLVLAGCAILEALLRLWPSTRLRVADRGLREGILTTLMAEDGVHRHRQTRHGGRR
ncbi:MAG TPA: Ppx/GppA phosphatase family protein [Hyphomicrobiaceae bacterium]|nr:Ppx/GppA phosphatase family protein [Hyphomicrobiaceae bacterium]